MRKICCRTDVDIVLSEMVHLDGLLKSVVAERDAAVLVAQSKRQPRIEELTKDLAARHELLQAWANKERKKEFGDEKTLTLSNGSLSFRTGQRALKFLEGWDVKKTLEHMVGRLWLRYIRKKPEVNKQLLLQDSADDKKKLTPAQLKTIGLVVEREEHFHIELTPPGATLPQLTVAE